MKQVKKTLLTLVLVAASASASTIGSALARPTGGGTLPPQPSIGVQQPVRTCYY